MKVTLPPAVGFAQAQAVLQTIQAQLSGAWEGPLTVDAAALNSLDTACIAVLLQCRREAQSRGSRLELQNAPKALEQLLSLYGVAELFPTPDA